MRPRTCPRCDDQCNELGLATDVQLLRRGLPLQAVDLRLQIRHCEDTRCRDEVAAYVTHPLMLFWAPCPS